MANLYLVTVLLIVGLAVAINSYPMEMDEFEDDVFRDDMENMLVDKRARSRVISCFNYVTGRSCICDKNRPSTDRGYYIRCF